MKKTSDFTTPAHGRPESGRSPALTQPTAGRKDGNPTATVATVHDAVPGRVRFKVEGLHRSSLMKRFLEARLKREPGVRRIRASHTTGTLLLRYDSAWSSRSLADRIHQVITTEAISLDEQRAFLAASATSSPPVSKEGTEPSEKTASRYKEIVKTTLRLFHADGGIEQDTTLWHTMGHRRLIEHLDTDLDRGLTTPIVLDRLRRLPANTLPDARTRSRGDILWGQINSLPVYLLAAAAGVSMVTGGVIDAIVVVGVVAANAYLGFVTERRAEQTISSLKHYINPRAIVIRDGNATDISARDVTVGDIIEFKPGMYVAADCRVIDSDHLSIDESMLTGESMPVLKTPGTLRIKRTPLADRSNMAFMGTLITGGQGRGVVVATGPDTEIGRLQKLLDDTQTPETPIERQLRVMGDKLVMAFGVICGAVFVLGLMRGYGLLIMLRTAISLAASAVPEGLPAAATINFALGIRRMREHHVLIRRLQAVETLGAIETICLDKTGTLTENRMTVTSLFTSMERTDVDGASQESVRSAVGRIHPANRKALIHCCALCNESEINGIDGSGDLLLHGSATENALVHLAARAGVDVRELRASHPMLKITHRSENRLFMDTRHAAPEGGVVFVKGSPMEVLGLCGEALVHGRLEEMSGQMRDAIESENDQMAGGALRVLGLAYGTFKGAVPSDVNGHLVWIGLVGMADPIRPGVSALIPVFHRAGIDTIMITGDQSPTAFSIASHLNIAGHKPLEILDSAELTSLDSEVLQAIAKHVFVYSRVSPAHKLKIVQAIQANGKTVAMTGDGINDGPALKAADLGIAMGQSGTDIAREVADVVLQKDNLDTLIIAVKDGRGIYQNIRKSVRFFLATNFSEIMVMTAGIGLGIGSPLNVMQLLWINIISDIFPGLSLSMEAPEPDVLERSPRPTGAPLFTGDEYRSMMLSAAAISGGALGAYGYGLLRYGQGARAGTLAFQALTLGQLLHAFNCRRESGAIHSADPLPPNPYLNMAVWGSLAFQGLTFVVPPLRRLLGLAPTGIGDLGVIAAASLLPMVFHPSPNPHTRTEP